MAVTRSRAVERAEAPRGGQQAIIWQRFAWRRREAIGLLAAWLLLLLGFFLVYRAKTRSFAEIEAGIAGKQLLNLNDLSGARGSAALPDDLQRAGRAPIRGTPDLRCLRQPAERRRHRPATRLRSGSRTRRAA